MPPKILTLIPVGYEVVLVVPKVRFNPDGTNRPAVYCSADTDDGLDERMLLECLTASAMMAFGETYKS